MCHCGFRRRLRASQTRSSWTDTSGPEPTCRQTGGPEETDRWIRRPARTGTDRQTDRQLSLAQHPPVSLSSGRVGVPVRSGQHGGGDPGHLPPGGPGDPVPDPDQRARAARHPGGLQTGSEQTEPQILLQVCGRRLRVSHVTRTGTGTGIQSKHEELLIINIKIFYFIL